MFHIRAKTLLAVLVLLISALAAAQISNQTGNTVTIGLTAKNIAFNTSTITVPAGSNVVINFDNQDSGIPHNFAVYSNSSAAQAIFKGNIITGPKMTTYTFTAPTTPGTYFFRCDVHPSQMKGQFVVSAAAVSTQSTATSTNVTVIAPANVTTKVTVTNTTNVTRTSSPYAPGFDGIFAVVGLLAAAYLVFGRKK